MRVRGMCFRVGRSKFRAISLLFVLLLPVWRFEGLRWKSKSEVNSGTLSLLWDNLVGNQVVITL